MIYQAYQTQANFLDQVRPLAAAAGSALRLPWPRPGRDWPLHTLAGVLETFANLTVSHARLPFGIESVPAGNRLVPVTEEAVYSTPFATLLHFKKATGEMQPRVLVVAPMSGHFATLLRATVKTMLTGHDVYITDWHNARDVPLADGCFDFSAFVVHLVEFLRVMGAGSHVVAVCQPCVPVLAAAAMMAEDGDAAQPRSMTLMAGPIDTRISPPKVNELALRRPINWFERNLIAQVPADYEGARRKVYPGFMQLAAFLSMNLERHLRSFKDMVEARAADDQSKSHFIQAFYEEYFAVMDLPAEFYIETIRNVFQEHLLPQGKLTYRGRPVNPASIKRMGLMTVEGEKDDICSIGQTLAAQDLCTGVRAYRKVHHMQAGVGHYGVFSGRRWNNEIYPLLRDFVHVNS